MSTLVEEERQSSRKTSFGAWFSSRISAKLALIMILVVVMPLFGLGVVLTFAAQKAVKASVQRDHQEIAKRAAHEVSLFVERPLELLESAGSLIAINQTDPWQQETVLVELSLNFPVFEEVLSFDRSGKILASSNPGKNPRFREKDEALKRAMGKEVYLSDVYLSDDYLPYLDVGIPYFKKGAVAGALMARINLRGMWDIIDGIRLGKTGRAFLVSKKGILIAHPDKKKVLKNMDILKDPAVSEVLSDKTGTMEEIHPGEGQWLVSYSPISSELEWAIVVEQQTREAYALLNYMRWTTAVAGLLAVLAAILVSVLVSRRMVKPVRSLDFWSRRIAIGDFDYLATHRSRDELGRLFIAFKRMRDRLREAREQEYLVMLGMASSTLAHKIKNSIVSLKVLADLFPSKKQDSQFMGQFETEFPDSVERLEVILRQLSKVASENKMNPVPVNLRELFDRLEKKYQKVFQQQKIQYHQDLEHSLPPILGDRERLFDVFENLMVNAIEAMPDGGELLLKVKKGHGRIFHPRFVGEELDLVEITVDDKGSGIPKEKLEEIFHPFVTMKRGGMGIGLAIVKKIILEHSGSIEVDSELGKGTTFTIRLPLEASKYGIFKS